MAEINDADVLSLIERADKPMTAAEIAEELNSHKTMINSILYRMENIKVSKSDTVPPYWSLVPLEEQVIRCLSDCAITAQEIADDLEVDKSAINSILYRLEGKVAYKDNEKRPNWYLISNSHN